VVRQIPFSTQSIEEDPNFKLTRFLELPRWKIVPEMVRNLEVGRSDSTHFNMVKLDGDFANFSRVGITNPTKLMSINPPIFDNIDIGRSGIHPYIQTVNSKIEDVVRHGGFRVWTEVVADRAMGSQFTINGSIECCGIQSPIAEGDVVEFEDIAYHVEAITDSCAVSKRGKTYSTILHLTNGMPTDQKEISPDFPRYAGFTVSKSDGEKFNDAVNKELESVSVNDPFDTGVESRSGNDTMDDVVWENDLSKRHSESFVDDTSGANDLAQYNPGMTED
jgi:hypothetical protein